MKRHYEFSDHVLKADDGSPVTLVDGQTPAMTGWVRDFVDIRDMTVDSPGTKPFLVEGVKDVLQPSYVIQKLPEPRPQGSIGSCTAHAVTYLLETFRAQTDDDVDPLSRLFVYKVTRSLLGWQGDTGAFLRTAMQAITMFGAPPEKYNPYDVKAFEQEPSAFLYALAQNYQALTYYRLDGFGVDPAKTLDRIKANLILNRPCMFGIIVYSIDDKAGNFLMPRSGERPRGGHAITAVGYDDARQIKHTDGHVSVGAVKIANWWTKSWGDKGFGYVPYEFVTRGLATDWWTMMSAEWVDLDQFNAPR